MPSGVCPECGVSIPRPEGCCGMWSGAQANGRPAGGGWYQLDCPDCGVKLVAYENVYDELGNIRARADDWEPELYWQRDEG
jgi:rubredoxin